MSGLSWHKSPMLWTAILGCAGGLFAMPSVASAQTIKQSGATIGGEVPRGIDEVPWFKHPDVLAHIKVNSKQFDVLNEDYGRFRTEYDKNLAALDAQLAENERLEREADYYRQFQQNLSESLDRVITDRVARRRYDELYHQYQGYRLFHNPSVRKQLELSSEQLAAMREHDREWRKELETVKAGFEINRPVAMRQLKHARRQMRERILETLSAEQQEKWMQLTGEQYEFPAPVYIPSPPQPSADLAAPKIE